MFTRRDFGKTTIALSSSLLLPGKAPAITNPKISDLSCKPIHDLFYFRWSLSPVEPFPNLKITFQSNKMKYLKIEKLDIIFSDYYFKYHQGDQPALCFVHIGDYAFIYVPVKPFADGWVTPLHNVSINAVEQLIIRKKYISSDKIGAVSITPERKEFLIKA